MRNRFGMLLGELMAEMSPACGPRFAAGSPDLELSAVHDDSREVAKGSLFIAVPGALRDGRDFVPAAIERGAAAVIVEAAPETPDAELGADLHADQRLRPAFDAGAAVVAVADGRQAAAEAPFIFYRRPDRELRVVGVTGTNGKTTTATLIRQIAQGCGLDAAELGTIGLLRPGAEAPEDLGNTTPGPVALARLLRELADTKTDVLAMEVSSHAIEQRRVAAIQFAAAVFTNLSHDHLDYHGSFEEYAAIKIGWLRTVAEQDKPGALIVNVDDEQGRSAAAELRAEGAAVTTYSAMRHRAPTILTERPKSVPAGTRALWRIDGQITDNTLPLAGIFNVANAAAAVGAAMALGLQAGEALRELSWARAPAGRFERIDAGQKFTALVDYAHTPDALENVLRNARAVMECIAGATEARGARADEFRPTLMGAGAREDAEAAARPKGENESDGGGGSAARLIVVFGAGGDRDRAKRPKMGAAVAQFADIAIVTSDNPRSEDPGTIVAEVRAGMTGGAEVREQVDRRLAIREAVALARRGDVVVVAGKGHETYQEIAGNRLHFDDREELRAAIEGSN